MITFENHAIDIRTGYATEFRLTPATIGVGTGLAYNAIYTDDGELCYTLTHVSSGYRLVADIAANQKIAQRWLEKVVLLVDWTVDMKDVKQQVTKNYGSMLRLAEAVTEALADASEEVHSEQAAEA